MPAAEGILTNSVRAKADKYDILRSPRPKRPKHGKHKHQTREQAILSKNLYNPKISVLSKPEDYIINGRNRHRFPDPSQDKHILLGIFDQQQTLIKLHYIDDNGIFMDESLEKEILKDPFGIFYFIKLEQTQIDLPNCESEIQTEYFSENIICAKLSDHTIVDSCVPKEVAGYWVRTFGTKCTFTMNFTLWSAELNLNNSGKSYFNFNNSTLNEDFYNLKKLDDIHVQFRNKPRKSTKSKASNVKAPSSHKTAFQKAEYSSIINVLRSLRDNGKLLEFEAKSSEILKAAKSQGKIGEELVLLMEKSLFFCYQGQPSEGKRLLQKAVHLASKCNFSDAVKNRAYLFLALIHIYDCNYGTAQECLGMVANEMSNSMSTEDLIFRSLLHGIIMLSFGQKISNMSQNLWHEATEDFENALEMSAKLKNSNYDDVCMIHFWLGKLNLEMLKSVCSPGCKMPELEIKIAEQIKTLENLQVAGVSKRVQIFGLLLKAEYAKFLDDNIQFSSAIEQIKQLFGYDSRLYFHEIKMLQRLEQERIDDQKKRSNLDVKMLTKTRDFFADSDSESGYTADDSSSEERIDLGGIRYEQTTYV